MKIFLLCVSLAFELVHGLNDGLCPTPPMGFSSWNAFKRDINQDKIISTVDAIKRLGLDKYGYNYVVIDDLWSTSQRNPSNQKLQVNTTRFPKGIKFISDYIHQNDLKFGLYANAGVKTCAGMAGSLGYEQQDLNQFLEWNIDYLKYDNCYPRNENEPYKLDKWKSFLHFPSMYQIPDEKTRFTKMSKALFEASNKKIVFEMCLYGFANVEKWGRNHGHIWRTTGDIKDRWPRLLANIDINDEKRFTANQGPNIGWNYPDALFIGKGGMSNTEYRTMFALWCAVKSPLMLGSDLSKVEPTSETFKTISNDELIAINQDKLGIQATCKKNCCSHSLFGGGLYAPLTCPGFMESWQAWSGLLENGDYVVIVVNRYDHDVEIEIDWFKDALIPDGAYEIRDLWQHKNIGTIDSTTKLWNLGIVELHDNRAFRLKKFNQKVVTGSP